ncbi:MAG TPA: aminotransferase class I/II-fold pyridoxal phosphate-dependent enzyme [Chitinophagaceae bacterium]|nr:aminotransferase class I/II-fold pyridoxal phosphate-dependent enzyme [Chitinophagaceae bacterium]
MSSLSHLANTLIPSEIIKLGNEINERIKQGQTIYNYTIGDFDPSVFPIPQGLEDEIVNAYRNKKTNYPAANGILECRTAVADFIKRKQKLDYNANSFLISGGGRPLIYAAYRTICDRGEKVIYPVPSWNNNHYTHFIEGEHICIETKAENNFLPTAEELIPHFKDACLLALCSPLNPTGTVFSKEQLTQICEAVLAENQQRGADQKPLYILYDQIYWTLTFGDAVHYDPVSLIPELRNYTIFIDGISKSFCATGVRVGWAFGPDQVIDKMKGILSHIGAWSPMAEQVATGNFLRRGEDVEQFLLDVKSAIHLRLQLIYDGIMQLKNDGYAVDAISPMAAMYLTIRFSLKGKKFGNQDINSTADMTAYLLEHASLAIVPFSAFGADKESEWYRLSVGTCHLESIPMMFANLRKALDAEIK